METRNAQNLGAVPACPCGSNRIWIPRRGGVDRYRRSQDGELCWVCSDEIEPDEWPSDEFPVCGGCLMDLPRLDGCRKDADEAKVA